MSYARNLRLSKGKEARMKKIISIAVIFFLPFALGSLPFGKGWGWASAQSIDTVEYFFDIDPGVGNGTIYTLAATDTVNDTTSIAFGSLSAGFHNLFIRIRDTNGTWSLYEGKSFFIQDTLVTAAADFDSLAAEYFYDADPGVGNGTAISLTPGDSILDTAFTSTIGLLPGLHSLYIRVKDSNNVWSLYEGGSFYLYDTITAFTPPVSHPIAAAEYFIDTDPGVGNGIAINAFTSADSIIVTDTLPTAPLTAGTHYLYVRIKDTMNVWSLCDPQTFVICNFIPVPDFSADTVCVNTPTTFIDLSSNLDSIYTYSWDFNSDNIADDTTTGNTSHTYNTSGTHTVSLIVNNTNGCIDTIVKTVYVDSLPSATFILPVDTICKDDTLTLSGGNPAGGVYSGIGVYAGAYYGDSVSQGTRTIYYTYYNSDSCSVTVSDAIFVSTCTGINENNLADLKLNITPNPFRTNTIITIQSKNQFGNLQFVLFDVFGKELRNIKFESENLKLDRENMPVGIYLYKVIDQDGKYVSGKLVVAD